MVDYKKQGKKNRASGKAFELKVRKDLESKGWIVSKWANNIEFTNEGDCVKEGGKVVHEYWNGRMIPAKGQYNPFFKRIVGEGSGFPDFIAFYQPGQHPIVVKGQGDVYLYDIVGYECKINGYLDKIEKEKCKWLIENKVFNRILIASKGKKRGEIIYSDFKNQ